jgi:hypothetical protein
MKLLLRKKNLILSYAQIFSFQKPDLNKDDLEEALKFKYNQR